MLNQRQIHHQWPVIKEKILKHWNRLTEAEVDRTQGNVCELIKLVKKHYGTIEDFEEDFEDICSFCELRLDMSLMGKVKKRPLSSTSRESDRQH